MSRTIYFDDIVVGLEFESAARTIGEADIITFAGLSGDFNALHTDAEFAATTHFGQRVAHGMLIASISTGLRSDLDDFAMLAFLNTNRSFSKPVFIGDTVRIRYRVNSTEPSTSGASRGWYASGSTSSNKTAPSLRPVRTRSSSQHVPRRTRERDSASSRHHRSRQRNR